MFAVFVRVCVCVRVHALLTPWHVWLPPFRPGQAVTRQGKPGSNFRLDEAIRDQRAHCTDKKTDRRKEVKEIKKRT